MKILKLCKHAIILLDIITLPVLEKCIIREAVVLFELAPFIKSSNYILMFVLADCV